MNLTLKDEDPMLKGYQYYSYSNSLAMLTKSGGDCVNLKDNEGENVTKDVELELTDMHKQKHSLTKK